MTTGRPWAPITGRKIRFAVVGCGRISKSHFESIRQHADDAELVAVCDPSAERRARAAATYGGAAFASVGELLRHSDADIVSLCTPSGLHPQQAIEIAGSGRHVMTEKPMATRWRDGLAMIEACDNARVMLFVVKQNRLNATLQLLKKAIDNKRFGRIYLVTANVLWSRPQQYYDQDAWRGTWEFDGGALMNQASHYVDLLDWLIGPIESIHAYTATLGRNIEVDDTAVMNVRWRSGALGSMSVTMLTYPKNLEGSITVIGEKGTVSLGGVAVNEVRHWEFADAQPGDADLAQSSYETQSVYGFGHAAYYANVIQTLRGQAAALTDGRAGLRSLEVLIAAYLSARDGRRVSLPLDH